MPRLTREHVDARRRQILRAAYDRFARDGFHRTTMKAVAEEAGLSAGALYRYFEGKEELIRAVAKATRSTEGRLLGEVDPDADALEELESVVRAFVRVLDEPWARSALLLNARVTGEALDDPVLRAEVESSSRRLRGALEEILRRGRREGTVRDDLPVEATSAALAALMRGVGQQALVDPSLDTAALEQAVRALVGGLAPAVEGQE